MRQHAVQFSLNVGALVFEFLHPGKQGTIEIRHRRQPGHEHERGTLARIGRFRRLLSEVHPQRVRDPRQRVVAEAFGQRLKQLGECQVAVLPNGQHGMFDQGPQRRRRSIGGQPSAAFLRVLQGARILNHGLVDVADRAPMIVPSRAVPRKNRAAAERRAHVPTRRPRWISRGVQGAAQMMPGQRVFRDRRGRPSAAARRQRGKLSAPQGRQRQDIQRLDMIGRCVQTPARRPTRLPQCAPLPHQFLRLGSGSWRYHIVHGHQGFKALHQGLRS